MSEVSNVADEQETGESAEGDERVAFGETLVDVDGLKKYFTQSSGLFSSISFEPDQFPPVSLGQQKVKAVDDVSFEIKRGETLGLVGESGCGKSTLGRSLLRLVDPTDGTIEFKGEDLADISGEELRQKRSEIQMIFQDPQSSLDPRMKMGQIVEEPMRAHDMPKSDPDVATTASVTVENVDEPVDVTVADDVDLVVEPDDGGVATVPVTVARDEYGVTATVPEHLEATASVESDGTISVAVSVSTSKDELRRERAKELLGKVGLDPAYYNRYPHAFSGGQRQRINLARALSVDPDFVVCDEPVSALDVSIQAQVMNTMEELQEEFGLTYLFIAHDLSVIRHISDRVAVMYLGHIVEIAEKEELFENPQHPYTKALLESIPVPDPRNEGARGVLEGEVPSPQNPPSGCRFRTRCPELIAPDEYDLPDEQWAHVRTFMRAVKRRTFEPMTAEELEAEFFGGTLPWDEAGEVVRDAIDLIATDRQGGERTPDGDDEVEENWEEATDLLLESFAERSICAQERPSYELESEYGSGTHFAACHRHR
ncbi:oligopeptide/dipeptide ABC transporter, ATP-binding protein, C-terminal domain-containing protein [Natronorubrum sediminis]|uniref:Oligopeptide/dipeptide ABC transporter, ATP-binding protein, C-terminal domain-containing protein n=1 Tax=Natronorubrum sediminis TaxID=640943 RepID=A0A1H6G345_9EURY|nr:oligopeptide/dipeptide ABC transporter ATP-binding protein [Natronorubrum sediminis]SEH17511.1 oligopeptide/dipeptide ABC transporter, ATP-binding protein, C-terminal domain-containing protein [Natronorubrum sediminis]